jgi:hypothetical protein
MSFINFKSLVVVPMDESSTMTMEQALDEKQSRENHFRQGLQMANRIINNNPMILSYYWYLWTCRERDYSLGFQPEQMIRRMVEHMPLPTAEQRSLLQQHLNKFVVFLENHQLYIGTTATSANTSATIPEPYIRISHNVFHINDDNNRWFFVAVNILHELVHCFEPVHVDLEHIKLLFCSFVNGQHLREPVQRTFEQGEIFEIMMFGGIIGRIDEYTLLGRCSESDTDFYFVINHHHQYRHFFHSYDLTIIYNIINRKKRRVLVHNFFRSVGRRVIDFFRTSRAQTIN